MGHYPQLCFWMGGECSTHDKQLFTRNAVDTVYVVQPRMDAVQKKCIVYKMDTECLMPERGEQPNGEFPKQVLYRGYIASLAKYLI